jgi:predicted RecA/RadA family phage recombinase
MTALSITASRVRPVLIIEQDTKPAAETITRGQVIRQDTSGKWVKAAADTSGHAGNKRAIALHDVIAGQALTGLRKGLLDIGDALSALAFDALVYLSDTGGGMDTAAGTVSTVIGTVESVWAATSADKLLRVDL